jgi:hypothetical protein
MSNLPTLTLSDGTAAQLRMPSIPHRLALHSAYLTKRDDQIHHARITGAALGLAWPSDQVPPPWQGGLAEDGGDLAAFGDRVWASLEGRCDLMDAAIVSATMLAVAMRTLGPSEKEQEKARGNSKPRPGSSSSRGSKPGRGTSQTRETSSP